MRLMLNTLHYLENGSREEGLLKPIFELRLMTELGMMPDLLMCRTCGEFLPNGSISPWKRAVFHVRNAVFPTARKVRFCSAPLRFRPCGTLSLPISRDSFTFIWAPKIWPAYSSAQNDLYSIIWEFARKR